jgi:DNA-binding NtrC family response regulator
LSVRWKNNASGAENRALRTQLQGNKPRVIHASAEMRNIVGMAQQVGPSSATVLITGRKAAPVKKSLPTPSMPRRRGEIGH